MSAKSSVVAFPRAARPAGSARRGREQQVDGGRADFSDTESLRVLDAAAHALAYELGRQFAREQYDEWCRTRPK